MSLYLNFITNTFDKGNFMAPVTNLKKKTINDTSIALNDKYMHWVDYITNDHITNTFDKGNFMASVTYKKNNYMYDSLEQISIDDTYIALSDKYMHWVDHRQNFKYCLWELQTKTYEIDTRETMNLKHTSCQSFNENYRNINVYEGFIACIDKLEKKAFASLADLKPAIWDVGPMIRSIENNTHVDVYGVKKILGVLEPQLYRNISDFTQAEQYALETFVENAPNSALLLTEPHLIGIIGIVAYAEVYQMLRDGGFKRIVCDIIDKKTNFKYFVKKKLGLYNIYYSRIHKKIPIVTMKIINYTLDTYNLVFFPITCFRFACSWFFFSIWFYR